MINENNEFMVYDEEEDDEDEDFDGDDESDE